MTQLSIEQFELIRRLRNSGIDKEDLIAAFDQFEEVDSKFGDVFVVPASKSHTSPYNSPMPNKPSSLKIRQQRPNPYHTNMTANNHSSKNDQFSGMEEEIRPPVNNSSAKPQPNNSAVKTIPSDVLYPHFSRNGLTISAVSTPTATGASTSEDAPNWSSPNISKVKKEDGKSEATILSEIRHFIVRHNVKLSMIAEMASIIPAAVRNYIHGNLSSVSDETKQKIYMWYQMARNNPASIGDLIPLKRERFVFRGCHLRILEENYKLDAYPDHMKREFIAEECNRAYEQELGIQITDVRDKVTVTVISNWFNNRRKEAKRQVKRGSQNPSGLMENSQMVKLSEGLQYESLSSPPGMETQDIKPNISEMIQTSSINTPPSYSSTEDSESFMTQDNEAFIPMQNIKQEPPDIN